MVTVDARIAAANKQVMSMAWSPAKNIFTTGLMLWMSGTSIRLFSIYSTGMALVNPVTAIAGVNKQFKRYAQEGVDTLLPMLIFVGIQLVLLGIALWKCHAMGLLPMTSADWTDYIPMREMSQVSSSILP